MRLKLPNSMYIDKIDDNIGDYGNESVYNITYQNRNPFWFRGYIGGLGEVYINQRIIYNDQWIIYNNFEDMF